MSKTIILAVSSPDTGDSRGRKGIGKTPQLRSSEEASQPPAGKRRYIGTANFQI
jgi:hypothetical protein